jgi:hypothetical protein
MASYLTRNITIFMNLNLDVDIDVNLMTTFEIKEGSKLKTIHV